MPCLIRSKAEKDMRVYTWLLRIDLEMHICISSAARRQGSGCVRLCVRWHQCSIALTCHSGFDVHDVAVVQVPACDSSSFFPVEVNFTATKTLCDIQVRLPGQGYKP